MGDPKISVIIPSYNRAHSLSRQFWGMDQFRIRALVKILTEGHLSAADRLAATAILCEKCQIYLLGARKRRKSLDIGHYQHLLKQYAPA